MLSLRPFLLSKIRTVGWPSGSLMISVLSLSIINRSLISIEQFEEDVPSNYKSRFWSRNKINFSSRFKVLTKSGNFNLFHKQHSDEVELSSAGNDLLSTQQQQQEQQSQEVQFKGKQRKILVQQIKESVFNVLDGESPDGIKPKWKKARMLLVRAVAGPMIEIYIPPKVNQPIAQILRPIFTSSSFGAFCQYMVGKLKIWLIQFF